jgi:uncharacterized protein
VRRAPLADSESTTRFTKLARSATWSRMVVSSGRLAWMLAVFLVCMATSRGALACPDDKVPGAYAGQCVCPTGQSATSATQRHCCWAGQTFSTGMCVGKPTSCPTGTIEKADACEVPMSCFQEDIACTEQCALSDAWSCGHVALNLRDGKGVTKDVAAANAVFHRACALGSALACDEIKMTPPAAMLARHQVSCAHGDGQACARLGSFYFFGAGVEKNAARGVELFEAGCDNGYANACLELGATYAEARGVVRSVRRGAEYVRRACKLGMPYACGRSEVAWMDELDLKPGDPPSKLDVACAGGDRVACNELGEVFSDIAGNAARAAPYFRRACLLGVRSSCAAVAHDPEMKRAYAEISKACAMRDYAACQLAGQHEMDGVGTQKNPAHAVALLELACDHGITTSCGDAGMVFALAIGVNADAKRARTLFEKACAGGDGVSCTKLSLMFSEVADAPYALKAAARGCELGDAEGCTKAGSIETSKEVQSYEAAESHFVRGCEGGDDNGCFQLGVLLAGKHDTPSTTRARATFQKLCDKAEQEACVQLQALGR